MFNRNNRMNINLTPAVSPEIPSTTPLPVSKPEMARMAPLGSTQQLFGQNNRDQQLPVHKRQAVERTEKQDVATPSCAVKRETKDPRWQRFQHVTFLH